MIRDAVPVTGLYWAEANWWSVEKRIARELQFITQDWRSEPSPFAESVMTCAEDSL